MALQTEFVKVTSQLRRAWGEERHVRMTLLKRHAWLGIWAGVLISAGGGISYLEASVGPWTRPLLSGLAVAAGSILLFGLHRKRGVTFEIIGLCLMGLWDCLMFLLFVAVIIDAARNQGLMLRWPWDLTPFPGQPVLYPVGIYLSITLMIWKTHLPAAWRDHKRHWRRESRSE